MLHANATRFVRLVGLAAAAALALCVGRTALAGPITASYLAAGAQTPNFPTTCGSATSCFYGTETTFGLVGGNFRSNFNTGIGNFNATTFIKGDYGANGDPNWEKASGRPVWRRQRHGPYPVVTGGAGARRRLFSQVDALS